MVVVQAVLRWKETSLVAEEGVGRLGGEPDSLRLWRCDVGNPVVLLVVVVVAATEAVGGSCKKAGNREDRSFIMLVDSLQRERGSCSSSCWSWDVEVLLLLCELAFRNAPCVGRGRDST
jgi:hypothetical protein